MKEVQGAEVVVSGQITKDLGFGYHTTVRDGEAFTFGIYIPELGEYVPMIADSMSFDEKGMQIIEGMVEGDRVTVSGYPVIVNGDLFIEVDDNPYFAGEEE